MSISKREFDALLKRKVKEAGGEREFAESVGVTFAFIKNVLACRELPGKKICKHLGVKPVKEIRYRYEVIK